MTAIDLILVCGVFLAFILSILVPGACELARRILFLQELKEMEKMPITEIRDLGLLLANLSTLISARLQKRLLAGHIIDSPGKAQYYDLTALLIAQLNSIINGHIHMVLERAYELGNEINSEEDTYLLSATDIDQRREQVCAISSSSLRVYQGHFREIRETLEGLLKFAAFAPEYGHRLQFLVNKVDPSPIIDAAMKKNRQKRDREKRDWGEESEF